MKSMPLTAPLTITIIAAFIILSACWDDVTAGKNVFPSEPVNFSEMNSPHDDYNSAMPAVLRDVSPLCFSTNRRDGKNFDLMYKIVQFSMDRSFGELVVNAEPDSYTNEVSNNNRTLTDALETVNTTTADELGPLLLSQGLLQSQPNSPAVRICAISAPLKASRFCSPITNAFLWAAPTPTHYENASRSGFVRGGAEITRP